MRTQASAGGASRLVAYATGLVIGIAATAALLPTKTVLGTGGLWVSPPGDTARSLTGHLAFQADPWRWPLLSTQMLAWPLSTSVAMADGNSAISLLAKGASRSWGALPVNLLGAWYASCVLLQPVAAVFALRGTRSRDLKSTLTVAMLAIFCLSWLARVQHVDLMAHFAVLIALGIMFRMLRGTVRHGWMAGVGQLGCILFHPYLFVMSVFLLSAVPIETTLKCGVAGAFGAWSLWAATWLWPLAIFFLLSGTLGGGESGVGLFSMNLLSPVWPQASGLFGSTLPMVDATGGQYEGFNYLGAGVLFLVIAAAITSVVVRRPTGISFGVLFVLVGLTLLALSNRVYAGHSLLLYLGNWPWDRLLAPIRATGRFFWPVGYALIIGSIVTVVTRLPRWPCSVVFGCAVLLQIADAQPLWRRTAEFFAGDSAAPVEGVRLPEDTTLLSVVPSSMCTASLTTQAANASILLRGARLGWRLSGAWLSRSPSGFSCEKDRGERLTTPVQMGEARVFTEQRATDAISIERLGSNVSCTRTSDVVVCSRKQAHATVSGSPP